MRRQTSIIATAIIPAPPDRVCSIARSQQRSARAFAALVAEENGRQSG
jgi:hypothetical protein